MEKKGLCISCVKDRDCIFSGKSSVWECEEHSFGQVKAAKASNECSALSETQELEEQE